MCCCLLLVLLECRRRLWISKIFLMISNSREWSLHNSRTWQHTDLKVRPNLKSPRQQQVTRAALQLHKQQNWQQLQLDQAWLSAPLHRAEVRTPITS